MLIGDIAGMSETRPEFALVLFEKGVFHRQGHAIKSFRKVWGRAVCLAGCPGRIPHFRRTTESVYPRYAIVSEGDCTRQPRNFRYEANPIC